MVMVVVVFWTATASIKWGGSDDNEVGAASSMAGVRLIRN